MHPEEIMREEKPNRKKSDSYQFMSEYYKFIHNVQFYFDYLIYHKI